MEGNLLSDSFNIKEECRGEADYSFTVNRVIGGLGIDWFV